MAASVDRCVVPIGLQQDAGACTMSARNKAPGVRELDGLFLKTLHYHALANYGLLTRAAIAELSERELLRIPRLGPAAVASINRELARHGLMLRREPVGCPARSNRRVAHARFGGGAGRH